MKNMPCALKYETSFMHKDVVNHVVIAEKHEFIITISVDGSVKFWKKQCKGIVFGKSFKTHSGVISAVALNHDESRLVTASPVDCALKLFDVVNFDFRSGL